MRTFYERKRTATLIRWWIELNRFGWPNEFTPKPGSGTYEVNWPEQEKICRELGYRAIRGKLVEKPKDGQ